MARLWLREKDLEYRTRRYLKINGFKINDGRRYNRHLLEYNFDYDDRIAHVLGFGFGPFLTGIVKKAALKRKGTQPYVLINSAFFPGKDSDKSMIIADGSYLSNIPLAGPLAEKTPIYIPVNSNGDDFIGSVFEKFYRGLLARRINIKRYQALAVVSRWNDFP